MKRTALRKQSARRRRENALRDRNIPRPSGEPCEAKLDGCTGLAVDRHEVKSRARGGSITDPENVRALCRRCHDFVTQHPLEAHALGLSKWSWE